MEYLSPKKPKIRPRCHDLEQYSAARPRFHDVIPSTLGYGCYEAVIFWAKHAPNSENQSSEDREVDNSLEHTHFTDLVKDTKSVAGSRQF